MPTILPGFVSGGQALFSGAFLSGVPYPSLGTNFGGVRLKLSNTVSGLAFAGVALGLGSGGITLNSGGNFSSGGLADAWEFAAGQETFIPRSQFADRPEKVHVNVLAAVSGTLRINWRME